MVSLTKHFTEEELTFSETANRLKINNKADLKIRFNLLCLCKNCLELIREHYKMPVIITSGYRCAELNRAVGGAVNEKGRAKSQHCYGQAADFVIKGISIDEIIKWCRNNLEFDQLINEKNQWVHISYNTTGNRKQVMFFDGKTYKFI